MSELRDHWQGTFECWQNSRFGEIYARETGRRLVRQLGLQHFLSRRAVIGGITLYCYVPRIGGEWIADVQDLARRMGTVRLSVYTPDPLEALAPYEMARPATLLIDLRGGEDVVWSALGNKTRNMIRRAEKNGLCARPADGNADVDQWWSIYAGLAKRAGFPAQDETLVRSLLGERRIATLFVCEHEGRITGGSLFLSDRYPMYWLGAVDRKFGALAPGHLTMWRAIVDFAGRGFPLLDLGGIAPAEEGSTRFKKSFSRDVAAAYLYDVPLSGWKRTLLAPFLK